MGLFDSVKKVYDKASKKLKEEQAKNQAAQDRARDWDIESTCREYYRESNTFAKMGYLTALKKKCEAASDRELIDLFEYAYSSNDEKLLAPITSSMLKRGLLEKDENGTIHKNYY